MLSGRGLSRADHLTRRVIPTVVCLSVNAKPRKLGDPGPCAMVKRFTYTIIDTFPFLSTKRSFVVAQILSFGGSELFLTIRCHIPR